MSVLILGAGLVVEPLIRFLTKKYQVTLASRTLKNIEKITNKYPNSTAVECDVKNGELLENLISSHDITISMLPYIYHKIPFQLCVSHCKHFLSTSYTQDHMLEHDNEIKSKNLIVVNEAGLYPGCETASIMEVRDSLANTGYKVESLTTFCGGVPAPDANTNPFGYKFSWAPRGVLLAERNGATYLQDGEIKSYSTRQEVMEHTFWENLGGNIGMLEGIANRDSIKFIKLYGIEGCKTFVRGSLRYPGWTNIIKFFYDLDLLNITEDKSLVGLSYLNLLADRIGCNENEVETHIAEYYDDYVNNAVKHLDLLNPEHTIPGDMDQITVLDAMAHRMNQCMQYKQGERDMIPMVHRFIAVHQDGSRKEVVSKGVFYGDENGTAMENTVSLPVAVVADLILSGEFTEPGVHILNKRELYLPVLAALREHGYNFCVTEE